MIKRAGVRIFPQELERVLAACSQVDDVAVLPWVDTQGMTERVIAFVVGDVATPELVAWCQADCRESVCPIASSMFSKFPCHLPAKLIGNACSLAWLLRTANSGYQNMISTQDSQLVLKSTNDSTWRVVHEHRVPFGSVHHRFVLAELDTRIAAQHPELPVPQQSSILKISLYCAEMACLQATRARLAGVYDLPLAAIECVAQPYHGSGELAALIWVIEGEQVGRLRQGACHILRQPELEWAIAGWQSESHAEYALEALTESAFQSVEADLRAAGFGFAQWVRTWIYIGQIEAESRHSGTIKMSIEVVKNAFNHWSAHRYPASTGIGSLSGLGLTSLAVASACATVIPVENRYQTSAWSYPSAISTSAPLFFTRDGGPDRGSGASADIRDSQHY